MNLTQDIINDMKPEAEQRVLEEVGSRAHKSAVAATDSAIEILTRRANLLLKDVARLKVVARDLERVGFSYNDHSYRALLADITDLERAANSVLAAVRLAQRSANSLTKSGE